MPAPEPRPPAPRLAEPQEDGYEAALRAADALFAARKAPGDAPPQAVASAEPAPSGPSTPGGRVLRDLNEPTTSPEMLRLEEERAPKRRGRKPGSKNKPKPVPPMVAQEALFEAHAATATAETPTATAPLTQAVARARVATLPQAARGPAIAAAQPGDKYAWVRTKLKPGQQWKRRLPKVAW